MKNHYVIKGSVAPLDVDTLTRKGKNIFIPLLTIGDTEFKKVYVTRELYSDLDYEDECHYSLTKFDGHFYLLFIKYPNGNVTPRPAYNVKVFASLGMLSMGVIVASFLLTIFLPVKYVGGDLFGNVIVPAFLGCGVIYPIARTLIFASKIEISKRKIEES